MNHRLVGAGLVSAWAALGAGMHAAEAAPPQAVVDDFNRDRQGWQVYDYDGGQPGGGNVFYPATWEKTGGIQDSGYIWGDDSRWRIDTPENPHSILAFINYREWVDGQPLDLRRCRMSVYLRGDHLDLKGAKCYFWVFSQAKGTRWHYVAEPLQIPAGTWSARQTLVLKNDEKLWHRSWSRYPDKPASLEEVLMDCASYGFSFVGFAEEVTGRFAMDQFEIERLPE